MHLALELIDHIIDLLSDDTPSLVACSFVSRNWYPSCRGRIHSKFHFKGTKESARRLEFYAKTPGLLACIQTLVINCQKSESSIAINEVLHDVDLESGASPCLGEGSLTTTTKMKRSTTRKTEELNT